MLDVNRHCVERIYQMLISIADLTYFNARIVMITYHFFPETTSDLKLNGTQKTPFSGMIFYATAYGVDCLLRVFCSKYHFLNGKNSGAPNQCS